MISFYPTKPKLCMIYTCTRSCIHIYNVYNGSCCIHLLSRSIPWLHVTSLAEVYCSGIRYFLYPRVVLLLLLLFSNAHKLQKFTYHWESKCFFFLFFFFFSFFFFFFFEAERQFFWFSIKTSFSKGLGSVLGNLASFRRFNALSSNPNRTSDDNKYW